MARGDAGAAILLTVDVVVSRAPRQVHWLRLQVPAGSTVRDVLQSSDLRSQVPGLTLDALTQGQWAVGVWGRKERLGHVLRNLDRLEIVRPLTVDPKEARRMRYQTHLQRGPKGSQRIQNKKKAPPSGA